MAAQQPGAGIDEKKPGFFRRMGRGLWGLSGYRPTIGKNVSEDAEATRKAMKLPYRPIDYRQRIAKGEVALEDLRARHDMLQMNARVTVVFFLAAFVLLVFFVESVLMAVNLVAVMSISACFHLLWSSRTWQLRRLHNATLSEFLEALGEDFSLLLPTHKFPDKV